MDNINLSLDFDKAVWDKQPLLIRNLGKDSNIYKFFMSLFEVLSGYLDGDEDAFDFGFLATQLFRSSASGKYLDEHGNIYGVSRQALEPDNLYRERIKEKFNFLHSLPSISLIKSYVKYATRALVNGEFVEGYDIKIYDSSDIGFISPKDWDSPEQLVMIERGTLHTYKLIEYRDNPLLDSSLLRLVLDDIISPFLVYDLRKVEDKDWSEDEA